MEKIITNMEFFKNHNLTYVRSIYENSEESENTSFSEWLEMKHEHPKMYKWVCSSDDGFFEDSLVDNNESYRTQEDAYEAMKDSVLSRVGWYAEYNEVIEDCCPFNSGDGDLTETPSDMGVHCNIEFHPHNIILDRNGCIYDYYIEKIGK